MPWLTLTSVALAASECAGPAVENAQLAGTLNQAELAFSALDIEGFQSSMDQAVFWVPCLSDPVSTTDAAQFHRLQGLRQFVAGEETEAQASFRSARSAQPDYAFPASVVPQGHAILDIYEGAAPGQREPATLPKDAELWIDGQQTQLWDPNSPVVMQLLAEGTVLSTTYMLPGDALPFEPAPPSALEGSGAVSSLTLNPQTPEQAPRLESGVSRLHRPRFFIGLGLGAAAIGGWALASQSKQTYLQPQPTWGESDLRRQERITNGLTLGAGAMGLASLGMMGSAVMVMRW